MVTRETDKKWGRTLLHWACYYDKICAVKIILSPGEKWYYPEAQTIKDKYSGDLPIHLAATSSSSIIVEYLLDPDMDFFAAGGDSITAVQLTTEIQRYLDATVFLAGLFDAPTVRSYTAWLRAEHAEAIELRQASQSMKAPAVPADFSFFEADRLADSTVIRS